MSPTRQKLRFGVNQNWINNSSRLDSPGNRKTSKGWRRSLQPTPEQGNEAICRNNCGQCQSTRYASRRAPRNFGNKSTALNVIYPPDARHATAAHCSHGHKHLHSDVQKTFVRTQKSECRIRVSSWHNSQIAGAPSAQFNSGMLNATRYLSARFNWAEHALRNNPCNALGAIRRERRRGFSMRDAGEYNTKDAARTRFARLSRAPTTREWRRVGINGALQMRHAPNSHQRLEAHAVLRSNPKIESNMNGRTDLYMPREPVLGGLLVGWMPLVVVEGCDVEEQEKDVACKLSTCLDGKADHERICRSVKVFATLASRLYHCPSRCSLSFTMWEGVKVWGGREGDCRRIRRIRRIRWQNLPYIHRSPKAECHNNNQSNVSTTFAVVLRSTSACFALSTSLGPPASILKPDLPDLGQHLSKMSLTVLSQWVASAFHMSGYPTPSPSSEASKLMAAVLCTPIRSPPRPPCNKPQVVSTADQPNALSTPSACSAPVYHLYGLDYGSDTTSEDIESAELSTSADESRYMQLFPLKLPLKRLQRPPLVVSEDMDVFGPIVLARHCSVRLADHTRREIEAGVAAHIKQLRTRLALSRMSDEFHLATRVSALFRGTGVRWPRKTAPSPNAFGHRKSQDVQLHPWTRLVSSLFQVVNANTHPETRLHVSLSTSAHWNTPLLPYNQEQDQIIPPAWTGIKLAPIFGPVSSKPDRLTVILLIFQGHNPWCL
ncbi:hypothetical protein C8R43DRAFT_963113 [Mycena crocata]|nr:hypothetical protein C8R43DRAFT_963113 [Mycena crocata]